MNHYQEYYQKFVQAFSACQSEEEKKALHRKLAKEYHPDSNPGVDEDIFKAASNAFRDIEKGTIKSSASSSQTPHSNDASWTSESAPRPCRQNFKTEAEVDAEIRYFEQRRVEYQKSFFHYHSLYNMMEKELYESRRMLDFNLKELHRYERLLPKFEQKLKRETEKQKQETRQKAQAAKAADKERKARLRQLEQELTFCRNQSADLTELFQSPLAVEELIKYQKELKQLNETIDRLENEWLELSVEN